MVECKDLDEALKWAAQIPSAHRGPVEVRPIMEFEAVEPPQTEPAQMEPAQ